MKEISTLRKALLEENAQKKRMSYQNEELQWKLRRNKNSIGSTLQVAPGTSKVERVVKKRGSIGYVLDLDESPRKIVKTNVQSGWIQGPKSGKRRPNEVTF